MKSKIISILSSIGALIMGCFGGACGVACISGGCCGGAALFGLIGLSGSTLQYFEKLTPVFLVLTIVSLSYAFYKAYKPIPVNCCNKNNNDSFSKLLYKKRSTKIFFNSKSFLWATTILCVIMWLYPYTSKFHINTAPDCNATDTTVNNTFIVKYS